MTTQQASNEITGPKDEAILTNSLDIRPNYCITFSNPASEVGKLDFNGPELAFSGKADEAAALFIEFVATSFKGRLEEEYKRGFSDGMKEAPTGECWIRVVDEAMVGAHLGVADMADDYGTAKKKLNDLICWHVEVDRENLVQKVDVPHWEAGAGGCPTCLAESHKTVSFDVAPPSLQRLQAGPCSLPQLQAALVQLIGLHNSLNKRVTELTPTRHESVMNKPYGL